MARKSSRPSRSTGLPSDNQPGAPDSNPQIAPADKEQVAPARNQPTTPASDQSTEATNQQPTDSNVIQPTGSNQVRPSDCPITQPTDAPSSQTATGSESQPTSAHQVGGLAAHEEAKAKPNPAAANEISAKSVKSRCEDRGHRREKAPHTPAAKRKGVPLTPLAEKMLHDLQLAGMSARTQESYLRAVRKFAQFCRLSPDKASENDLRRYLLFIKNEQHWEANSLNVAYSGLKFFYKTTCPREWATLKNLRVPKSDKLPTVLSIPEVDQLMAAVRKPLMRCFLWTVYALGLRLQEALHLQVNDIDSRRMVVHVRRGKGHKDRLVPLTPYTLDLLRRTWATHRNPLWIFPAEGRDHKRARTAQRPMEPTTPQSCMKKVVNELGWGKRGVTIHTLRHCFATHLLEAGVNLRQIQKYLGHATLLTSTIYLHLTTVGEEAAIAKLKQLLDERFPEKGDRSPNNDDRPEDKDDGSEDDDELGPVVNV